MFAAGGTNDTEDFSAEISSTGVTDRVYNTIKHLMFMCPLFREFRKLIKIAKLKGANIKFQILENDTSLKNRCWCIQLAKITFSI